MRVAGVAPCDEVESDAPSAADTSFSGNSNPSSSAAADAAAADAAADIGSPPTASAASGAVSFALIRRPMAVLAVRASLVRRHLARRNAKVEPSLNTRVDNDAPPDRERLADRDADALVRRLCDWRNARAEPSLHTLSAERANPPDRGRLDGPVADPPTLRVVEGVGLGGGASAPGRAAHGGSGCASSRRT